ncbi:MAG: hypothetical protein ACPG8W_00950 [Candidatus Promineifilaceae bacterium]
METEKTEQIEAVSHDAPSEVLASETVLHNAPSEVLASEIVPHDAPVAVLTPESEPSSAPSEAVASESEPHHAPLAVLTSGTTQDAAPVAVLASDVKQETSPLDALAPEAKQALVARSLRRVALRRARRFTDALLENEDLRSNLHDTQAGMLIDWATERLELMAEESAELDDAAADRLLSTLAKGTTSVIQQIDLLVGGTLDHEAIADEFRTIAENSAEQGTDSVFNNLYTFATNG